MSYIETTALKKIAKSICKRCGLEYEKKSPTQKYCGSRRNKTGCAFAMIKEYKHTSESREKRIAYDAKRYKDPKVRARMKAHRQTPAYKEIVRVAMKKFRSTSEYKEWRKKYRATDKVQNSSRDKRYKDNFGITLDEYNEMSDKQNGLCAICGKPETLYSKGSIRKLAVDHDHKDGRVRGLLCTHCNQALGLLKDDVNILARAIEYLK